MRIVVFGTGPFAVPTFEQLLKSDHEVVAVVTRPIANSGRRRKTAENPVRDLAESNGLMVMDPGSINTPDSIDALRGFNADLYFVCDYGQILSSECLSTAWLGGINLHGSLLPKYRGAAPINWAIYNGEKYSGVTVIHMTPRLDAGPCLTMAQLEIGPDETTEELEPRLAVLGVQAVEQAIELLANWNGSDEIGTIQDKSLATKAPRLNKSDGRIDWSKPAQQIKNQIRAFQPWPGSFSEWQGEGRKPMRLILHRVQSLDSSTDAKPGTVIISDKTRLVIQTGEGSLEILQIQPAGKRAFEIAEFLRGYQPSVGEMFS